MLFSSAVGGGAEWSWETGSRERRQEDWKKIFGLIWRYQRQGDFLEYLCRRCLHVGNISTMPHCSVNVSNTPLIRGFCKITVHLRTTPPSNQQPGDDFFSRLFSFQNRILCQTPRNNLQKQGRVSFSDICCSFSAVRFQTPSLFLP